MKPEFTEPRDNGRKEPTLAEALSTRPLSLTSEDILHRGMRVRKGRIRPADLRESALAWLS